jgi:aspartate racemase
MKTLGILGGMGPAATVSFLEKVVRLSGDNWPRIVLEMDPSIPSRTLAAMGKGPDCGPAIHAAIRGLEAQGADVIAVPCNSAHAWYPSAGAGAKTHWLHMPVSVSAALHSRDIWHPLILGGYATISKRLYDPFFAFGCEYLDDAGNEAVYQLIADIKKDPAPGRKYYRRLRRTIRKFRKVGYYDAVLLGCTELSIIWPTDSAGDSIPCGGVSVFDSSWEYAKAIMRKLRGGI